MTWLFEHTDICVPEVHRADGRDIVMELIEGPTMMEDLDARPWRLVRHARTLASLQRRLNSVEAPGWFPERAGVPVGDNVLHLDLHPMNIILGKDGPTVIDWTNAARGDGSFDAAMSYVLMAGFEIDGLKDKVGRRILVETFKARRGPTSIRSALPDAIALRLLDPNTTAGERAALERMGRPSS